MVAPAIATECRRRRRAASEAVSLATWANAPPSGRGRHRAPAPVAGGPDHNGVAVDGHGAAERSSAASRQPAWPPGRTWRHRRSCGRRRPSRVGAAVVVPGARPRRWRRRWPRIAEEVARRLIVGRQLGDLAVRGAAVGRAEDVGRARPEPASSAHWPRPRRCHRRRHGGPKSSCRGVGGRQLGHLDVRGAAVGREDVDRAAGAASGSHHDGAPSIATECRSGRPRGVSGCQQPPDRTWRPRRSCGRRRPARAAAFVQ